MDLFKSFHNPTADVNHSVFDLSCRRIFSSKAGQCIPALVLDTVPSDKFRINMQALMRSNTLNTPAFVRGKFNYDFFFVPYTQLWHRFNDFVSQKRDIHTSYFKSIDVAYTPQIELKNLLEVLLACYFGEESELSSTLENDLGYYFNDTDNSSLPSYRRGYIRENLRLLNMLGYGNFEYLCDYTQFADVLAEIALIAGDNSAGQPKLYINPFRLLAYQHIWYDIYRNKYFDQDSINIDRRQFMYYFNADDVDCSGLGNSRNWNGTGDYKTRFVYMTSLHYCQWKKDIYTAVVPSQQFGVVSSIDIISSSVVDSSQSVAGTQVLSNYGGKLARSSNATAGSVPSSWAQSASTGLQGSFDILSLRRAEALQKWKEAALRAGNMNDKNQKAHFGVEPYYYEDNNVHFLGSFDGTFQINPVQSTAATSGDNGAVGDLAATGTSVVANGHEIEFDCRDYGIIMCIERFIPESEYSATGIERSNQRFEPFDYYQPEFSRLGLQAVPLVEQCNDSYVYSDKNFVLGYAPRDYDYKQMQDKVYGEFMTWHDTDRSGFIDGSFAPWVSPRQETLVSVQQGSPRGRGIDSFYVHPNVLDNVFKAQVDANSNSDQFVHQCYFDIKAVRPMPVLGLPEF